MPAAQTPPHPPALVARSCWHSVVDERAGMHDGDCSMVDASATTAHYLVCCCNLMPMNSQDIQQPWVGSTHPPLSRPQTHAYHACCSCMRCQQMPPAHATCARTLALVCWLLQAPFLANRLHSPLPCPAAGQHILLHLSSCTHEGASACSDICW